MLFSIGGGFRMAHRRKMTDLLTFVTCYITRASAFVTGATFNAALGALGQRGLRFVWTGKTFTVVLISTFRLSRTCLLD